MYLASFARLSVKYYYWYQGRRRGFVGSHLLVQGFLCPSGIQQHTLAGLEELEHVSWSHGHSTEFFQYATHEFTYGRRRR